MSAQPSNLTHLVKELLQEQKKNWPLFRTNSEALSHVLTREFRFDHHSIKLQFNPERIRSTGASVDTATIAQRPCFLCEKNRPVEQKSIPVENDYLILCNPFPIFKEHLTIVHRNHIPQDIRNHFPVMLRLVSLLPDMVVFYNGPGCGASAPDHFHFQAGEKGFMPLDNEYAVLKAVYGNIIWNSGADVLFSINDQTRKLICIESGNAGFMQKMFQQILASLSSPGTDEEPMMNILCSWQGDHFRVIIIPRGKHRPDRYFEEGEKKITVSPASVDLAGMVITPLQKDFQGISQDEISEIFREVCLDDNQYRILLLQLKKQLHEA